MVTAENLPDRPRSAEADYWVRFSVVPVSELFAWREWHDPALSWPDIWIPDAGGLDAPGADLRRVRSLLVSHVFPSIFR